jgi:hypothetical protein
VRARATSPSSLAFGIEALSAATKERLRRGGERLGERRRDLQDPLDRHPALGDERVERLPSTSCMVRKWTPSASSTEWTVTIPGWSRAARAFASR